MKSTINLFKAVPIEKTEKTNKLHERASLELAKETIRFGFIFSPEVVANYPDIEKLVIVVKNVLGLSADQMNASFHKSWKKVKTASDEQLFIEQIIHYITTYGFESLGIYDKESVFIPVEKLKIPKLEKDVKLVVIRGLTKKEIKEKLLVLLQMGVALKEETKNDVLDVATYVDLDEKEVSTVKNKEVKIALYDYLNIVPKNPLEFLRYTIYKATNETLLIKNAKLVALIKGSANIGTVGLFNRYAKDNGLERLAEIFYRFKLLFLAFRTSTKMKKTINKIRRLAVANHKPMEKDFLNDVTGKIKNGKRITKTSLKAALSEVNTFRKIRLAYALKYRTKDVDSILYKIRNGKGYSTDFEFGKKKEAQKMLDIVLEAIAEDLSKNVKGKKIYIPDYINYALPATEKQFSGNLPSGSYISIPTDMIIGVHWENQKDRVDLDLSAVSLEVGKIGWDARFRDDSRSILFSGDVTDAPLPNGASELLYVKKQKKDSLLITLNYYNQYNDEDACPFQIIVAKETPKNFKSNYMIDPNNVIVSVPSVIDEKQRVLGLLITTTGESRFYFSEVNIGNTISASSEHAERSRKYLINSVEDSINLKDLLERAGAILVDGSILVAKKEKEIDIDLSPEALEKDTILKLLV